MAAVAVADHRTPYAQAARTAARTVLRDTLFGAARDLLRQRGAWSRISMADVAAAAGVSRQTLYKTFGSRDAFALALVIQEGERFLDTVEAAVRGHADDPRLAVRAGVEAFLASTADDPLVRVLLTDAGTSGALPFVTTQGLPVVEWATHRLTAVIGEVWPRSGADDSQMLAESVVRLAISYLTAPRLSADAMAATASEVLGPFAERAMSGVGAPRAGAGQ
jgi:AcrR family transcriptional regulator